jgi:putative transposase
VFGGVGNCRFGEVHTAVMHIPGRATIPGRRGLNRNGYFSRYVTRRSGMTALPWYRGQLSPAKFEIPLMTNSQILPHRTSPNHAPHPRDTCDIIFITVCTKDRIPLLANEPSHEMLRSLWQDSTHWLVGRYVLLPEHLHLFVQRASGGTVSLKHWVTWWKQQFSLKLKLGADSWQQDFWDTRMRSPEHYGSKWLYVRDNPVRHGLVASHQGWSYQGEIYKLQA